MSMLTRRSMLKRTAAGALLCARPSPGALSAAEAEAASDTLRFTSPDVRWQRTYDAALSTLAGNVKPVPRYNLPLLVEGAVYAGCWQECGPHEALVYREIRPDIARQNHLAFFALQRPDGQLPASIKITEVGFGQIQMVVPIAATAWELAQETGDDELLRQAYDACSRWDDWLVRFRNTRGTGLVEGFCTYDTGHDNSPRWAGVPNRCPDADAKRFPAIPGMPRLCPDLSATVYGGRVALAEMAGALGRSGEQAQWREKAEALRMRINDRLYSTEDACFFDLDSDNDFVRVRGDVLSRVCGEHVVDQARFEQMWRKQLGNTAAFWARYPLPSIALDDPAFVRPIPRNSWGGATQALTALRAPRWMEHYQRVAELAHLMERWTEALARHGEFRQQMDPLTGEFTQADPGGYSPAALAFFDFTWRLGGPRLAQRSSPDADLQWNVRPDLFAPGTVFSRRLRSGSMLELRYIPGGAVLTVQGRVVLRVHGRARVLTTEAGVPRRLTGTCLTPQAVRLTLYSGKHADVKVGPNATVSLHGMQRPA